MLIDLIKEGDYVVDKNIGDIKVVKALNEHGVTLDDINGSGRLFYSSTLFPNFSEHYKIYNGLTLKDISIIKALAYCSPENWDSVKDTVSKIDKMEEELLCGN